MIQTVDPVFRINVWCHYVTRSRRRCAQDRVEQYDADTRIGRMEYVSGPRRNDRAASGVSLAAGGYADT